ncbi:hypothetical protein BDK51DRAFT_25862 [Blyttiomyces helicus]|uniref:Uncharacterized protein n=1 Tax=Blyttiomyces helicus TaxID=388810 RepID=A0A4P9W0D1_9FUNG|nr:hypothetical protein BDK51DRAFT_25862 [Blyttiomyces helicus]|eukprot:RKO84775.1 hypothetical protein BDK51DRAFT_25862 [Blyttiomyces helicus]
MNGTVPSSGGMALGGRRGRCARGRERRVRKEHHPSIIPIPTLTPITFSTPTIPPSVRLYSGVAQCSPSEVQNDEGEADRDFESHGDDERQREQERIDDADREELQLPSDADREEQRDDGDEQEQLGDADRKEQEQLDDADGDRDVDRGRERAGERARRREPPGTGCGVWSRGHGNLCAKLKGTSAMDGKSCEVSGQEGPWKAVMANVMVT